MKLKRKYLKLIFLDIFFVTLFIISSSKFLISSVFLVWFNMMMYSYFDLEKRISLFAFGLCFFNFLLGRQFLERFFGYRVEDFSESTNTHAELTLLIALVSVFIFYIIFSRIKSNTICDNSSDSINNIIVRNISKKLFYISNTLAIINALLKAYIAISHGYFSTFTEEGRYIQQNNNMIFIFDKFSQMLPVFIAIYLATLPSKRESKPVLYYYFVYLFLTIFTGHRSEFIIGLLWILIYLIYRSNKSEEIWIKRKYLFYCLILFPILIIFLGFIGNIRIGVNNNNANFIISFIDFFYDQGVSINVIKRSFNLQYLLNSERYYSLSFIPESIFGRLLGFKQYYGNTIEHAKYGYTLSHTLSYVLMGDKYLNGVGTGTSYIAELYHDFGYYGVFIGNILYAWLLSLYCRYNSSKVYLKSAVFLIMMQLLWSPRGNFSDIILIFMQPFPMLAFLLVYILSKLIYKKKVFFT